MSWKFKLCTTISIILQSNLVNADSLLLQRSLRNFIFSLNCISEASLQLYQETFPILATLYLLKIYHIDFIVSKYRISPVSHKNETRTWKYPVRCFTVSRNERKERSWDKFYSKLPATIIAGTFRYSLL